MAHRNGYIKPTGANQSQDWEKILDLISEQAIYSAQLLDGTMPQDMETLALSSYLPARRNVA